MSHLAGGVATPSLEFIIVEVSARSDLKNPRSPHGQRWRGAMRFLAQQPGCRVVYWGYHLYLPDKIMVLAEWDNLVVEEAWGRSEAYGLFRQALSELVRSPPNWLHWRLRHGTLATVRPADSELMTFHFPGPLASKKSAEIERLLNILATDIPSPADGKTRRAGIAHGWIAENISDTSSNARAYVVLLPVEILEAGMNFQQTSAFQEGFLPAVDLASLGVETDRYGFELVQK
ncbi:MAG: hypothetical protein M1817_001445 [Caeruleum heppii]|nr:MAG: hypothetical protein M1817_001445 [Caeruleum heppii]